MLLNQIAKQVYRSSFYFSSLWAEEQCFLEETAIGVIATFLLFIRMVRAEATDGRNLPVIISNPMGRVANGSCESDDLSQGSRVAHPRKRVCMYATSSSVNENHSPPARREANRR